MSRSRWAGIGCSAALIIVAVALGILGRGDGTEEATGEAARFVAEPDLTALEGTLGHPVYWLGRRPPSQVEMTREADGSVYLRYLLEGAEAADPRGSYLTVGTYPVVDAVGALRRTAAGERRQLRRLEGGAWLLADAAPTRSVYLAFPKADIQVEVFDPKPGRALKLVEAGAVQQVG